MHANNTVAKRLKRSMSNLIYTMLQISEMSVRFN